MHIQLSSPSTPNLILPLSHGLTPFSHEFQTTSLLITLANFPTMQIIAHPRAQTAPNAITVHPQIPKIPVKTTSDTPSPDTPPPIPAPKPPPMQITVHPQIPKIPVQTPPVQTTSDNQKASYTHRRYTAQYLTCLSSAAYQPSGLPDPTSSAPHLQSATAATLVRATKKHQSRDKNSPPRPPDIPLYPSNSCQLSSANEDSPLSRPLSCSFLAIPPLFFTQPLNVAATILPHTPLAPCEQACYD